MIIAEIGQNHNGSMSLAKKLIIEAKQNGADIVKFQLFNAKRLFKKKNNQWYNYNCKTELNYQQVKYLNRLCQKNKIEFMASAFDEERVKWLQEIKVKKIKIASRSINDKALIKNILATRIPTIISLGKWKKKSLPKLKGNILGYLYCISDYPTELKKIKFKKNDFVKKYLGFSDHTIGLTAAKISISLGAKIIEKHFTLNKKFYGPDHSCSMTPQDLKNLSTFEKDFKMLNIKK